MGVVSLFADFTYEGGRSITGPFLAALGAGPLLVGAVAGVGEFLGYLLRLVSGRYVDRTGKHWPLIYLGYTANLLALPALALTHRVHPAAVLMFAERLGKGLRTPARDAILSQASRELGYGYAFGLHEVLDQIGAFLGPLAVAAAVAVSGYRLGFGVLTVPALLALIALTQTRGLEPERQATPERIAEPLPLSYRRYLLFAAVVVAGFSHFSLLAYHWEVTQRVSAPTIPLLFALAMGVDAGAAFLVGRSYDGFGLKVLYLLPVLALPSTPLIFFSTELWRIAFGVALWGAVLGLQESLMRAAVADLSPAVKRGTAYGFFDATFGAAWMVGSLTMGALYSLSPIYLVGFGVIMQVLSVGCLIRLSHAL